MSEEPYDPCFGDPRAGWYGHLGAWEPCPVCNRQQAAET